MKQFIKKTISRIILAGIVISLLPIALPAKAISTPTKMSQQEIDLKITDIKKTIKKIKRLKITIPLVIAGAGSSIALILAMTGAGFFVGTMLLSGTTTIPFNLLYTPFIFGLFVFGGGVLSGILTPAVVLALFGGLSAAHLLTTLTNVKKLIKIEKENHKTLTTEQLTTIKQFKNSIKGPILKGIIKGLKVRKINRDISQKTINQNPKFYIKTFGNEKKAKKIIQNYLTKSWSYNNLKTTLETYNSKIKAQKAIRDKYSMWKKPAKYHFHNTKLISLKLNPSFIIIKIKSKQLSKAIKKMNEKDNFKTFLKPAVNEFIQQADTIAAEFKKPI